MVKIFDIVKHEHTISCSYTPEDTELKGTVEVDVNTQEIKKVNYSKYEYGKKMYVAQVCKKISELLDSNLPLPKEAIAIWY